MVTNICSLWFDQISGPEIEPYIVVSQVPVRLAKKQSSCNDAVYWCYDQCLIACQDSILVRCIVVGNTSTVRGTASHPENFKGGFNFSKTIQKATQL